MLTAYRSNTLIPDLVNAAKKLSEDRGFSHYCSDEAGRLIAVLAGQVTKGKILEIGTGYGVGSSWILSSIAPSTEFLSVDHSKEKIDAVTSSIVHPQATFFMVIGKRSCHKGHFNLSLLMRLLQKLLKQSFYSKLWIMAGCFLWTISLLKNIFRKNGKGSPTKLGNTG